MYLLAYIEFLSAVSGRSCVGSWEPEVLEMQVALEVGKFWWE